MCICSAVVLFLTPLQAPEVVNRLTETPKEHTHTQMYESEYIKILYNTHAYTHQSITPIYIINIKGVISLQREKKVEKEVKKNKKII